MQVRAICLFLLGVFLFLLAIIKGTAFWNVLHNALTGLCGISAFFVGPLLVYVAVMSSFEKPAAGIRLRTVLAVVLLLVLSGAWQIFLAGDPAADSFPELLRTLWADGTDLRGGGILSLPFGWPILQLGSPGDKIVIGLMLVFLLMIITNSTVAGVMRTARKPIDKAVEMSRTVADSFAQQQEARVRRARVDIPLDDDMPRRRKKPPTSEVTVDVPLPSSSKQKLMAAAGASSSRPAPAAAKPSAGPSEPVLSAEAAQQKPPVAPAKEPASEAPSEQPLAEFAPLDPSAGKLAQEQEKKAPAAPAEAAPGGAPRKDPAEEQKSPSKEKLLAAASGTADPAAKAAPEPEYTLPPLTLLQEAKRVDRGDGSDELRKNAELLVNTLQSFGVQTRITDIARGPAVTRYELQPAAGVKISRITNLQDDIALNLAAGDVRIEAPIPGKAAVGIEIPNSRVTPVTLREVLASEAYTGHKSRIAVALGRDISGSPIVADIAKMPHLLIAGATGSGKSVCINTIIMSILYRARPEEVKLMLVDPKFVELSVYNGLPHLAIPVVSDPKKAAGALNWAVAEMDRRYQMFAEAHARDLASYNRLLEAKRKAAEEAPPPEDGAAPLPIPDPLPQYVIVVDELADLMMTAPSEVEDAICRLAQKARAAGMHLIIATQRPSVNVITGVIKANIPSRIAFSVSSQIDSRTILDMAGAEKLLGMGDMLFSPMGSAKPTRVQGCFVSDDEIERVVAFIKSAGEATYDDAMIAEIERMVPAGKGNAGGASAAAEEEESDPMLDDAIECVVEAGIASTSLLQRKCKLGYARAARLIDELEAKGIVGPFEGSKPRAVLISKERWMEMKLSRAETDSGIPEQTTL